MTNPNQLPALTEIIELQAELAPLLDRFDELKKTVREFGPGEYPVEGLGVVKISEPSIRTAKGTELKLNLEVFNDMPGDEQAELLSQGLIKTETIFSRAAASSVKVEPLN